MMQRVLIGKPLIPTLLSAFNFKLEVDDTNTNSKIGSIKFINDIQSRETLLPFYLYIKIFVLVIQAKHEFISLQSAYMVANSNIYNLQNLRKFLV